MYFVYMIRCIDNSIYTGITTDVIRRMEEHFSKSLKCAKYTLRHSPKKLECVWETKDRKLASKLEYHIKTLTKLQKEELIKTHKLADFLLEKIDVSKYELKTKRETNSIWKDIKR